MNDSSVNDRSCEAFEGNRYSTDSGKVDADHDGAAPRVGDLLIEWLLLPFICEPEVAWQILATFEAKAARGNSRWLAREGRDGDGCLACTNA